MQRITLLHKHVALYHFSLQAQCPAISFRLLPCSIFFRLVLQALLLYSAGILCTTAFAASVSCLGYLLANEAKNSYYAESSYWAVPMAPLKSEIWDRTILCLFRLVHQLQCICPQGHVNMLLVEQEPLHARYLYRLFCHMCHFFVHPVKFSR